MPDYYTRTGDDGTTGILGNMRLPKDHPRIEAVGALDEANAALGLARATCKQLATREILLAIQRDLYNLMAEVASTSDTVSRFQSIDQVRVKWLEEQAEEIGSKFEMPKAFIVPGDTLVGATIDLARTIVRRAERRVSTLYRGGEIANPELLRYLNRLSSLCFVLEVWETLESSSSPISFAKDIN